jgi:hypothetical protein
VRKNLVEKIGQVFMKIKTNVVEMLKCQGKTLVHGVSKDYIRRGKTQSCRGPGSAKQHQG